MLRVQPDNAQILVLDFFLHIEVGTEGLVFEGTGHRGQELSNYVFDELFCVGGDEAGVFEGVVLGGDKGGEDREENQNRISHYLNLLM